MSLEGKKLGVLISVAPEHPNFARALASAEAALHHGVQVYVYCIDDAVGGVGVPEVQSLRSRGVRLYACAYGAHKRGIALSDAAAFAGLTVVSDLIASTDRFLAFN